MAENRCSRSNSSSSSSSDESKKSGSGRNSSASSHSEKSTSRKNSSASSASEKSGSRRSSCASSASEKSSSRKSSCASDSSEFVVVDEGDPSVLEAPEGRRSGDRNHSRTSFEHLFPEVGDPSELEEPVSAEQRKQGQVELKQKLAEAVQPEDASEEHGGERTESPKKVAGFVEELQLGYTESQGIAEPARPEDVDQIEHDAQHDLSAEKLGAKETSELVSEIVDSPTVISADSAQQDNIAESQEVTDPKPTASEVTQQDDIPESQDISDSNANISDTVQKDDIPELPGIIGSVGPENTEVPKAIVQQELMAEKVGIEEVSDTKPSMVDTAQLVDIPESQVSVESTRPKDIDVAKPIVEQDVAAERVGIEELSGPKPNIADTAQLDDITVPHSTVESTKLRDLNWTGDSQVIEGKPTAGQCACDDEGVAKCGYC